MMSVAVPNSIRCGLANRANRLHNHPIVVEGILITRFCLVAFGVALISACSKVDGRQSQLMPVVDEPPSSTASYFAPSLREPSTTCNYTGTPQRVAAVGDFKNRWYSQVFGLAMEPSIYLISKEPRPADVNTLRFTWLRSFDPTIIIRVDSVGAAPPRLIAKQLSDESGNFDRRIARNLNTAEANQLSLLINQSKILDLTATEECILQMDGSRWIFEAANKSGYHFVERLSPERGPAREVGEYLLTLTGWSFGDIY